MARMDHHTRAQVIIYPARSGLGRESHTQTYLFHRSLNKPTTKHQLRRLPWTATTGAALAGEAPAGHAPLAPLTPTDADAATRPLMVELGPMEIRTFELELRCVAAVGGEGGGKKAAASPVPVPLAEGERGAWTMME